MSLVALSSVIYFLFWIYFRNQNKRRDEGKEDYKVQGMSDEEIEELGEHNPRFRYTY